MHWTMASQTVSDRDSQMIEVSGRDTLQNPGIAQNINLQWAMASQTVSDRDSHQRWAMSGWPLLAALHAWRCVWMCRRRESRDALVRLSAVIATTSVFTGFRFWIVAVWPRNGPRYQFSFSTPRLWKLPSSKFWRDELPNVCRRWLVVWARVRACYLPWQLYTYVCDVCDACVERVQTAHSQGNFSASLIKVVTIICKKNDWQGSCLQTLRRKIEVCSTVAFLKHIWIFHRDIFIARRHHPRCSSMKKSLLPQPCAAFKVRCKLPKSLAY